jgi:CBS-domain-containing membrane protein
MNASDVMVTGVITVNPNSKVGEVAELLLAHRISAMPVIDDAGKLVGMVSEGDLLRRSEAETGHERAWWLRLLMGRENLAAEYVREHGRKVADVMTRGVISAEPDTPVADIATLLERHRIKRVPIVQNGKVVGIVSRANLIQALATFHKKIDFGSTGRRCRAARKDRFAAQLRALGAATPGQCDRHRWRG